MQDHEAQFEVFETGPDGEFKPIFMVGKCPPPEKELLKQSILQAIGTKSDRDTPRSQRDSLASNTIDGQENGLLRGHGPLNRDIPASAAPQHLHFALASGLSHAAGMAPTAD